MLNEVLGKLAVREVSREIVEDISELFQSLYSPQEIQVVWDLCKSKKFYSSIYSAAVSDDLLEFVGSKKEWDLVDDSFFISLDHKSCIIAGIYVRSVQFPDNINQYLNLALSARPVFSMALSNSYYYESLKRSKDKIFNKNKQLEDLVIKLNLAKSLAEQADRAKSTFISNIQHELKTPLNILQGFSSILIDDSFCAFRTKESSCNEYLKYVESSGRQLYDLISELLELSRMETGSMLINKEEDLSYCILSEIDLDHANHPDVKLIIGDSIVKVFADKKALKNIIRNLLDNAIKFNKPNGEVHIYFEQATNGCDLVVKDTGKGFPLSELDRLVKPFEQLDASFTREHQGLGIGLSIVYGLVNLHNGTIYVESEIGVGSTFRIFLPYE